MYNVIVKTLDGRNHDFTVPDDVTVLDFKSIIREKMEIDVDRQRLLFQGRVLQDDNLLSSYNVAGNVMHLVTRPPPNQNRPPPSVTTEREENSDINRDQIRNILSDVFGNIADLSNPLGVSVNNERNRVDITVNMPSANRLSLARLRQNYIHRLMSQSRELIENLRDPSQPAPRADRDRLAQANAYDLGPNEERITEVTSQPLPIHNLADMIHSVRDIWRDAEPQLEIWENVLRRENLSEAMNNDREMQRMHDSASRYIHLFSHMLHIMSDYLVEFQHNANSRISTPRNVNETTAATNEVSTSTSIDEALPPLTTACGESAMPPTLSETNNETPPVSATAAASATATNLEGSDRSRYLYVFSEMPAQLLQVRLDVDSNVQLPAHPASTVPGTTGTAHTARSTRTTGSGSTAAQSQPVNTTAPSQPAPTAETGTPRSTRRTNAFAVPQSMENLFRTTLQDSFMGPSTRMNGSSNRQMRSGGSQLVDNVDPYVRCQSRHFQNPSNLRSGTVISSFGGIRFRESSRTRSRPVDTPVTTANNTNTPTGTTTGTTTATDNTADAVDGDPIRIFIGGLINTIFSTSGDNSPQTTTENVTMTTTTPRTGGTSALNNATFPHNDINRILQTLTRGGPSNFQSTLGQLFPEMLTSHVNDPDNHITNEIIQLVINRLTMIDLTQIVQGMYHPLNSLRVPLQNLFQQHQQQCEGSRERMLDHVVLDLEFFNRIYMSIFDRLRQNESVTGLSDDARRNFNQIIDIPVTINNLNRQHVRVVIDMIMRSPTDIGFGQLLMNSMFSHHNESLALLDILCNNNDELRQYMVRSFIESLMASMNDSTDNLSAVINESRNSLGLDWIFGNVNSRLFRQPEQLSELRETVLTSYVVNIKVEPKENDAIASQIDDSVEMMEDIDNLEEVVKSLSGNLNSHSLPDHARPVELMDVCSYQSDVPNHTPNGGSWQSVLPPDWLDIVSRDSNTAVDQQTIGIPYSDAYVSGMPPKRRKIILNQRHRAIQPVPEMMQDCLDQAIRAAGINDSQNVQPFSPGLTNSFQELVSDHVRNRLVEESFNYPSERFPSTDLNFNRKKRFEEDKKNN